jgi:hypothetical protein
VSQIPHFYDEDSFRNALLVSLQLEKHITLTIHSFASITPGLRTTTITFSDDPSWLYSATAEDARQKPTEWRVELVHQPSTQKDTVLIDTHFKGFTPVSPLANDEEHLIEYVTR